MSTNIRRYIKKKQKQKKRTVNLKFTNFNDSFDSARSRYAFDD